MECINHAGTPAAGTCAFCGKALCPECLGRFNPPSCETCLIAHNDSIARQLYVGLAITVIIFVGITIWFEQYNPGRWLDGAFFGLFLSGAYWGWLFLNRFSVPILFTSGFGCYYWCQDGTSLFGLTGRIL